jgi:Protein of unknown function (DUF3102)
MTRIVNSLDRLADRIRTEHEHFELSLRAGLRHAKNVGDLLIQAKEQVGHGHWLRWLRDDCGINNRTAQKYMRVARRWDELEAESGTPVSELTLREATLLLTDASAENPPDEPIQMNSDDGKSAPGALLNSRPDPGEGPEQPPRRGRPSGDQGVKHPPGYTDEDRLPHYNPTGWANHWGNKAADFLEGVEEVLKEGPAQQHDKAVRKHRRQIIKLLDAYCVRLLYQEKET